MSKELDRLKAIEKRLDELETDLTDARDHYGDAFGEVELRLKEMASDIENLMKRMSHQERPSPMLLDAMNRLHALDGKGNGDIDPPDVFALSERVARLEAVVERHNKRLSHLEFVEGDEPKPPAVCEGCAATEGCHIYYPPSRIYFRHGNEKPICYVEKKTCGTCKHPWRKPDHEDFPCFDHPGLAVGNYEKPSWRLEASDACPNYTPIEGRE
jgi:hypothetical protein